MIAPGLAVGREGGTMAQRIRILIVDDRAYSRAGLRALLATWPEADVIAEARDGGEAIEQVEKYRPHVVLMDIQMPSMDGLQATRQIKQRWPEVKVIALTMYATYRAEAMVAGADAFLLKGDPAEELWETIVACKRRGIDA